jgi:hypothetical protein
MVADGPGGRPMTRPAAGSTPGPEGRTARISWPAPRAGISFLHATNRPAEAWRPERGRRSPLAASTPRDSHALVANAGIGGRTAFSPPMSPADGLVQPRQSNPSIISNPDAVKGRQVTVFSFFDARSCLASPCRLCFPACRSRSPGGEPVTRGKPMLSRGKGCYHSPIPVPRRDRIAAFSAPLDASAERGLARDGGGRTRDRPGNPSRGMFLAHLFDFDPRRYRFFRGLIVRRRGS